MPFETALLEYISNEDMKNINVKERVLINMYILSKYDKPIKLTDMVKIIYGDANPRLNYARYGSLYRVLELLRLQGYVERYTNPVRYKLKYSERTASRLAFIARLLGFESATKEDFL